MLYTIIVIALSEFKSEKQRLYSEQFFKLYYSEKDFN